MGVDTTCVPERRPSRHFGEWKPSGHFEGLMRAILLVSVLLAAGCVQGDSVPTPSVDNDAVLAATLDAVADVVQRDGALKPEPRITNTRSLLGYLLVATEYRFGKVEPTDAQWRQGFSERFKARFEPDGEVSQLEGRRADVVAFLREEAGALRGEEDD